MLLLTLLVVLQACAQQRPEAPTDPPNPTDTPADAFDRAPLVLAGADQQVTLTAYRADTQRLRRRGLMGWEELPDSTGMLFVFDGDTRNGFWMKDTLIPLSIAFADADGRIHTILDMEPCEQDPCPTYSPDEPYRYALEVEQSFFEEVGAEPGWRLRIDEDGGP